MVGPQILRVVFGIAFLSAIPTINAQPPAPRAAFDVASIKPNISSVDGTRIGPIMLGQFNATNMAIHALIGLAYKVHDFEIVGEPSWVKSDRFDITAKSDAWDKATYEEMRPLLQSLLADRFGLSVHREPKDIPIYELTVAKGGSKLVAAKQGACTAFDPKSPPTAQPGGAIPRVCGSTRMSRNFLQAIALSIPDLIADLSDLLGRPVVDKTSLSGKFDIQLEFAPDGAIVANAQSSPTADLSLPSIFTALQEQLGLTLKPAKGPVEVLVIDRVERPSGN